jgi:hypothetical protein
MLIWDRNDPRSINRVTLSQGKLMTYRDGSNVPYYFVKDLDVSKYGGKDFGMMLYFVDDSDGRAIWKTRITDNFRDIASRNTNVPSNVTFKEE